VECEDEAGVGDQRYRAQARECGQLPVQHKPRYDGDRGGPELPRGEEGHQTEPRDE